MNEEIGELLLSNLEESHAYFNNIIDGLKQDSFLYSIKDLTNLEYNSYNIAYDAITKMNDALMKYNEIRSSNIDFFENEYKMVIKYILLYIISIIIIKIFAKTLSSEKINEIWYAMLGGFLGSINTGIIYSNVHEYRYGKEKNRQIMNEVMRLKEEYDTNFEIARREIEYMMSLNRNLENCESEKKLTKIIKGMQ